MATTESRELPLLEPLVTGNMKAAIKSAGGKSSDLWKVPHDKLHYDPLDNVRPLDPAHVRHIADLIKANDYDDKEPLGGIIKKVDDEDLIFVYIGQHRFQGALLAIREGWRPKDWKEEDGPVKLPIVIDAGKTVSRKAMIVAGTNSNGGAAMTPLDLAASIQALQREGETTASICNLLGITDQTVRDVLLLAAAPVELHDLVRGKHVASTLAIEEIRAHGPDKALERLRQGLETARQSGKTKVTRKALPKTAEQKFTPDQSKLLLQALRAVVMDPAFKAVKERAKIIVNEALNPFGWALENGGRSLPKEPATAPREFPIVKPNGYGVYPSSGTIQLVVRGRKIAHILVARIAENTWLHASDAVLHSMYSDCLKRYDDGDEFSTLHLAVRAAIARVQKFINEPSNAKHKDRHHVNRWLDQLYLAGPDVENIVEIVTPEPDRSTPPLDPVTPWPLTGRSR